MRKVLYITHLSGKRLNRFWISSIKAAEELGYEFHLACNMNEAEHPIWDKECEAYHIITHQIDFNRSPISHDNIRATKQLKGLLKEEEFDIVHCNTPVGGLIGRICSKQARVPKVIYQAHGFHFWKGAPLKNWILYYPVEKMLSRITDVLITINQEDYYRANHFSAKRVELVPGVGINVELFNKTRNTADLRKTLGIPDKAIVLLSVGELIKRKNHRIVIETLRSYEDVWYVICGQGPLLKEYQALSNRLGISNRVIFAGFITDIEKYYSMADVFVFPSYQEGLPVSLMEAMASGLLCLVSDIRGNNDLITNCDMRFPPNDKKRLINLIDRCKNDKSIISNEGAKNLERVERFKLEKVISKMIQVYGD